MLTPGKQGFLAFFNVGLTESETPLEQVGTGATGPQIGIVCLKRQGVILRFNRVRFLGSPGPVCNRNQRFLLMLYFEKQNSYWKK